MKGDIERRGRQSRDYITPEAAHCTCRLFTNTVRKTNAYHGLFNLVVNGHHTGTRGAAREEKNTISEEDVEERWL